MEKLQELSHTEIESQIQYARRHFIMELNRFKASGVCNLPQDVLMRSLDILYELERKGVRNFDVVDYNRLARVLGRIPHLN